MSNSSEAQINPGLKLALELGPVILFVLAYNFGEPYAPLLGLPEAVHKPIFLGTLVLMVATPIAIAVSYILTRKIPAMPLVTLVVVMIFGAITIYTQDAFFKKIQPTIVNTIFGAVLIGGMVFGKSFLKTVMDQAFAIDEEGWTKLTWRWGYFFLFLAVVNEIVWRNFSESFWVSFKLWGMTSLSFLFILSQMPLLMRHSTEPTSDEKG